MKPSGSGTLNREGIPSLLTDRDRDAFAPLDWALLGGVALIWGASFLFIEVALRDFSPVQVGFLRSTLGMAALLALPGSRRPVDSSAWPKIAVLGITWMALPFLLFPMAQQWIESSLAGMLNGSVPLWAAWVATIVARRLPPRQVRIGLIVGFAGVVLIGATSLTNERSTGYGTALIVLATAMYGVSINLAVPLQRLYGALPVILRAQAVASALTLPFAVSALPDTDFGIDSTLAVTALGVLGTGAALAMITTLAGRVGAARGAIPTYLVPVVAIGLGSAILDEEIHPVALLGTTLVTAGALITSRGTKPP